MKQSDVDNAYVALCMRFQSACQASNKLVKKKYQKGFNIETDGDKIEVSSLYYLRGWKYKTAPTNKTVDILLRSAERYSRNRGEITKSAVQVIYLKGGSATPLLSLHYDFESPPQPSHPVFHAQLGVTDISPEELKTVGFRETLEKPATPLYGSVRIPTPCMNLGAALLMLAADHLPAADFQTFLTQVRSSNMIRWSAVCDVEASLGQYGGYLQCHHWYR